MTRLFAYLVAVAIATELQLLKADQIPSDFDSMAALASDMMINTAGPNDEPNDWSLLNEFMNGVKINEVCS